MNYHHVVPPTRLGLKSSSATSGNQSTVVIFVHMRKHAGTSIRRTFESQHTWQLLPYCLPWPTAIQPALRSNASLTHHWFLELHCNNHFPRVASMLTAARETLVAAGRGPAHHLSFTVLRNPVDLTLSEHNFFGRHAFSHAAWVRAHPEDFLFSPYHLNLPRKKEHATRSLRDSDCSDYKSAALRALEPFDHVAFVEEPKSMDWIANVARIPDGAANATALGALSAIPLQNVACKYCHGDRGDDAGTSGAPKATTGPHAQADGSHLLRWNNESITVAKLRELASRENRCSIQVYRAIKAATRREMQMVVAPRAGGEDERGTWAESWRVGAMPAAPTRAQ